MKNLRLYVGCNVNGVPTHTMADVCTVLKNCKIENATITEGFGFYLGEMERTVIVTLCDLTEAQEHYIIFTLCFLLRLVLRQECIGVERFDNLFTWE